MQQTQTIATLGGHSMGTTWSVRLNAARNADLHALHAGIQARLDRVVAQMSTWDADSDISRYNRADAGTWLRIPEEFSTVLACALRIADTSDGAFDPTIGSLVGLWGFGAEAARGDAPSVDERDAARDTIGWHRIALRDGELLQPGGVRLDLSAIAKGFQDGSRQTVNLRANLEGLDIPIKVIWGSKDAIIPASHASGLPGKVSVTILDGYGHLVQLEAAAEVNKLLA